MADQYTEVTTRGFGQRMGGSIKGILVGLVMAAIGVALLFWGEGRAVRRAKALKEWATSVISVGGAAPAAVNEGELVHFSGEARAEGVLRDVVFGVMTEELKLERSVEMYQWREERRSEERKKLGGGTETVTTYEYKTGWSSHAIDSSSFKKPAGHQNPPMPFESRTWVADPIHVGGWQLSDSFVSKLGNYQPLTVGEVERARSNERVHDDLQVTSDGFYIGLDPISPRVGDVRVKFRVVPAATVSLVGRQAGEQVVPYTARVGGDIALLTYGAVGADAMFESAKKGNATLTWILRFLGFFIIAMGINAILKPLSVMADVVPMIGNLVEKGTGMIAFVLAAMVSLVTIAIGWIYYRPLLGVLLLAAAGELDVLVGEAQPQGGGRKAGRPAGCTSSASAGGSAATATSSAQIDC